MTENETILSMADRPNTVSSLENDFRSLGLKEGMIVLVHSSLSSLGWVCGGPVAVILALENVLTEKGTLIMPTHSSDYSNPEEWCNPPVPESWWDTIRNEMPLFDKDLTPTRGMGKIPETFRKQNGVIRSSHPLESFAAWGKHKEYIVQDNHYDFSLNEKSPLGRIYELNGMVLLLGVGYSNNTSFHLAEHKADYPGKKYMKNGFPVLQNDKRTWQYFDDIDFESDDFNEIGTAFEKTNSILTGKVGNANAKLINQKDLVDFAVTWMENNRQPTNANNL